MARAVFVIVFRIAASSVRVVRPVAGGSVAQGGLGCNRAQLLAGRVARAHDAG